MASPNASPGKKTAIQRATADTVDIWTIWYAARYGKCERVRSILDRKAVASIDVQEYRTRWSALHFACRYGQSDVVELLVRRGANLDLPDWQGNTPLHLCAGWGNRKCCVLVLEAGATVRAQNHAKQTPEQLAKALAREDLHALLVKWRPISRIDEDTRTLSPPTNIECGANDGLARLNQLLLEVKDQQTHQELNALYVKKQSFGDTHPGLLATYTKLVDLLRYNPETLPLAADFADEGLTLCEFVNGRPNTITAHWISIVGELRLRQGRYDESDDLYREAYDQLVELKGETDHECLVALENAAISSLTANRLDDCRHKIQKLLECLDQVYAGGANTRTLELSMQLARLLLVDNQPDAALDAYSSCVALSSRLLGETSEAALSSLDGMGKCCFLLGDFEHADKWFQHSLDLHLSTCKLLQVNNTPSSCPTCQRSHNNVALVAVARRSSNAVHLRLSSDLKRSGGSDY